MPARRNGPVSSNVRPHCSTPRRESIPSILCSALSIQNASASICFFIQQGKLVNARIVLFLFLFPNVAAAQTRFSFSGLKWDMTVPTAIAQLKSSSINVSAIDGVKCRVSSDCWVSFDDGDTTPPKTVAGRVQFRSGKLVSVEIHSDQSQAPMREAKLRKTYGTPNSVDNSRCSMGPSWCNQLLWRSPAGETIEFDSVGSISYKSSSLNSAEAQEVQRNDNRVRF